MENQNDESTNRNSSVSSGSGDLPTCYYVKWPETLLTSPIMLWAYAICLILLTLTLMILLIGIGYLSFWYPDKFNAWILVIASPAAMMIAIHLPNLIKKIRNGKYAND
jgi:hypothetical protein